MNAVTSWRPEINGKTVLLLVVLDVLAFGIRDGVLAPMFRDQVGFIPFDLQERLNAATIVIQLRTAPPYVAPAYLRFAIMDIGISIVLAGCLSVVWTWLFRIAPNRVFALLTGGGMALFPPVVAALELTEHLVAYQLLSGGQQETYASAVERVTDVHRLKSAGATLRDAFTLVFIAVAIAVTGLKRWRRTESS